MKSLTLGTFERRLPWVWTGALAWLKRPKNAWARAPCYSSPSRWPRTPFWGFKSKDANSVRKRLPEGLAGDVLQGFRTWASGVARRKVRVFRPKEPDLIRGGKVGLQGFPAILRPPYRHHFDFLAD